MRFATGISKSEYKKEITAIFNSYTRRGFADWRQCGDLCMDICSFLENAADALSREGRYADLFEITNRCYMKWSSTDKDDSNGETQSFCISVQEIWAMVYEKGEDSISHGMMQKWFMEQLEGHTVIDYMEDDLYDFMLRHFKGDEELHLKKAMLERILKDSATSKFSISVLEEYYIRVLADLKTPIEEIRDFVAKSDGYSIVDTLAAIEVEYGNYDAAISIYEKRIEERPDHYWSNKPRRALMDIYKKLGNSEKEFEQLQKLLWANVGDTKIFQEYKQHFSKEEWPDEWNKILEELQKYPGGLSWYAMECRYDIVMDKVEEAGSDSLIDTYKELEKLYPKRVLAVRVKCVKADAVRANKRADYRWLASKLKKISKYDGGMEIARSLATEFAATYPRRVAMLEELRTFL